MGKEGRSILLLRLESMERRVCGWREVLGGQREGWRLAIRKGLMDFRFYPKGRRDNFKVF